MRKLPEIQYLLRGVSPLEVFGVSSIHMARQAFYTLRKKYDFPYWAATDFKVLDWNVSLTPVPLRLNVFQRYLADVFIRRSLEGLPARYVISKTLPQCGLTTCVQAYILWRQLFWHPDHSISFAPDSNKSDGMKNNVARCFPDRCASNIVALPYKVGAFFGNFYCPQVFDGIPYGFVHLADVSKWFDRNGNISQLIFANARKQWNDDPEAIFVIEGDRPSDPAFDINGHRNYILPHISRMMQLQAFTSNPFFLNKVIFSTDTRFRYDFHHIDLNQAASKLVKW